MLAHPAASPTVFFGPPAPSALAASGSLCIEPVAVFQFVGRFSHCLFILANPVCPQYFDVCVKYLIALTVPQLFRSKQAPRLFPFFPRYLIVLSYSEGSLFVSSLPRYQRLEAYLLRIALKKQKKKDLRFMQERWT